MTTNWLSAIGILLSALVIGFMFVYSSLQKKQQTSDDDLDRRDLEAKRDALIAALRAGDLSDEEITRLEREAADVLRALDVSGAADAPVRQAARVERAAAPKKPTSALAGFLYGAGSVAAVVLIIWFANKSATPKTPPSSVQQLEATVKNNPDDNDSRIALAKAYLDRQNFIGTLEQTSAVLAKNPNEPRAQTYQAIVRIEMGQKEEAQKMLESATKNDPKLVEAWVALAWLRSQSNDDAGATRAIEEAIRQHPEQETRLRQMLAQMQQHGTQQPAQQQAQQQASGPSIHVTVNLAPGARTNGVLFIYARAIGQTSGPPIAVKRIEATSFPVNVDLSSADSMMGGALPANVRVEARLDADGNAMTKDPADPKASQDNVAAGASVTLTLR